MRRRNFKYGRGPCPACHKPIALLANGRIHWHENTPGTRCHGEGAKPATEDPANEGPR